MPSCYQSLVEEGSFVVAARWRIRFWKILIRLKRVVLVLQRSVFLFLKKEGGWLLLKTKLLLPRPILLLVAWLMLQYGPSVLGHDRESPRGGGGVPQPEQSPGVQEPHQGGRAEPKSCQSVCAPPEPGDLPSITVSPCNTFEAVRKSVSELQERLEDVLRSEFINVSEKVDEVSVLTRELKTRREFLRYSCQLTLDPNTVNKLLRLSEGNREVTSVEEIQSYPDHPERFDFWEQVLCREGLSGRCYWEAEWSGGDGVYIAVSYKDISRKGRGDDSALGDNNKSWALQCSPSSYYFWDNTEIYQLPIPSCSRIGVYLDHRAGTLSFYSISDTMTLLRRVQTTFTQPLYPGFELNTGSSVKLCDLGLD
ncbi:hypothetical protein GJAV_G00084960 [Gymnothorax javanicus]|nr:hypothetical protein GJAV_G00084960 [Gymnothorax javanicus]